MPAGVVKTERDEEKWDKAKELAAEAGKAENYAYIMGIYKKMKPDHFKSSTQLAQEIHRLALKIEHPAR